MNAEGKRVADTWDPAKDIAAGKQCMSYGAPNIMREPARLHITWANDSALKIEIDAGKQTRLFLFAAPTAAGEPSMQGTSVAAVADAAIDSRRHFEDLGARSQYARVRERQHGVAAASAGHTKLGGTLKVVTTHIKPGYLRNNGVPFSANAVLTEYYDVHKRGNDEYLVQIQIVEDPKYLDAPWVVSSHYRREPDGSKWDPQPCELVLPTPK